jgi:hypothetical protein
MYYLLIKEIEQTGLKYLCKRKYNPNNKTDHLNYKGSGKLWRSILKAHPEYTLKTTVLGLFTAEELAKIGEYYSNLYNVVESSEWANLMPEKGDGGVTHQNTHPFVNNETRQVVYRSECPEGFVPYDDWRTGYVIYHDPRTKEMRHFLSDETPPADWVKGGVRGEYAYGPRKGKTKVYHNGERKVYVTKGQAPPPGFTPGLHYEGTTKGRIGCFNAETGEKRYIKTLSDISDGFERGLPHTTGKKLTTPHGEFSTIGAACRSLNMTRYQIAKNIISDAGWFITNEDSWQQGITLNDHKTGEYNE